MCSLARPSALGCFDAAAFLDRRRGVCAAIAPAACSVMAREPPSRRAGAEASSAARNQKRARDGFEGKIGAREAFAADEVPVVPAPSGQQRLEERMRVELDAVRALHRKAVLLCRSGAGRSGAGAAPVAKGDARREAPLEAAAKRRKPSPLESAAEAAAHQKEGQVKQLGLVKRAAPPPSAAKEDAEKKRRRMEEMAREREEFRRLVVAMEKAALPDETVYRHDLEELGIAPFEYAVTRTRRQARCSGGGAR